MIVIILLFLLIIFLVPLFSKKKEPTKKYKTSAEILGKIGENKIAQILSSLPKEYKVFNDIYLSNNGMTTQIDHIVISIYGIFVIETKNYKGQIYGNDNSEHWTENFYGKTYKFYNPIKQNHSHIKVLQKLLRIPFDTLISVVVFSNNATLECDNLENIIYSFELKEFIKGYKKPIFNVDDVKKISDKLLQYNIDSEDIKEVHIKNVQQKVFQKEVLISKKICPKCGGKLVERKGRYGNFLGCSNYPKCKFTSK
ncbi:NERD domain-containing protein [uncultured Fusobacterium sp.]|uniref:NERD domain-containing protein n=1 Tax=uncultured Fusobacterium sp. TaxID=159267 RepID=UPI0025FED6CF|nr:NERD domain-containing protein [uncultured Fusobacterium sp.]